LTRKIIRMKKKDSYKSKKEYKRMKLRTFRRISSRL